MSSTAASAAERSRGVVLVAAAALCWSLGGLLARLVATDTWTTVFWRSIFAAAFLLGVTVFQERGAGWARLHRTGWGMGWPGVAMAVCFATASTCFINALARTTVANTLIIQSTSPFIAALLGWAWLGERVRRRSWLAMTAALALTGSLAAGASALTSTAQAPTRAAEKSAVFKSHGWAKKRDGWCRKDVDRRRSSSAAVSY